MIKILLHGSCLAVLLTTLTAQAQESAMAPDIEAYTEIQAVEKAVRSVDVDKLVEEGKMGAFAQEELLQSLLTLPYNKRQYVFPAVQEQSFFGKKIKTHPEIVVWKGKVPTDIPPQLKEFAAKHLHNLNPELYGALDPDVWAPIDKSVNNPYIIQWDLSNWQKEAITRANAFYSLPDLDSFYTMTPEAKKNFYKVTVSEKDIARVQSTIEALPDFYASVANPDETKIRMLHAYKNRQGYIQNFINPFKGLADRIQEAGESAAFESFIKKQGWKNINEFAEQSNTILKAYRVQSLIPIVAMQLAKIRKAFPIKPGEDITSTQMYAKLYEVSAGDALFVAKYYNQLKPIFENEFFGPGRLSIFLD